MKQQKHRAKILSFILSLLMLLGVPLPAFAQAAVENAIEEAQNQPVLMTDKLTETETYWQNADGSVTYEQHLEPIRYQDEAGQADGNRDILAKRRRIGYIRTTPGTHSVSGRSGKLARDRQRYCAGGQERRKHRCFQRGTV
ncbi:MAG: hypothetical protein KH149_08350 [Clostridiales bacterium]|nr:hypothetical protein [Clostridiales bacterium]